MCQSPLVDLFAKLYAFIRNDAFQASHAGLREIDVPCVYDALRLFAFRRR
jgi:hypothetical protein